MPDRPGVAALVPNEVRTDDNARILIAAALEAGVVAFDTARA